MPYGFEHPPNKANKVQMIEGKLNLNNIDFKIDVLKLRNRTGCCWQEWWALWGALAKLKLWWVRLQTMKFLNQKWVILLVWPKEGYHCHKWVSVNSKNWTK